MTHLIELSDDDFATLELAARRQNLTVQAHLHALIESMRQPRQVYDNLHDFFRSLGDTEEEIAAATEAGIDEAFPPDEPASEHDVTSASAPNR